MKLYHLIFLLKLKVKHLFLLLFFLILNLRNYFHDNIIFFTKNVINGIELNMNKNWKIHFYISRRLEKISIEKKLLH